MEQQAPVCTAPASSTNKRTKASNLRKRQKRARLLVSETTDQAKRQHRVEAKGSAKLLRRLPQQPASIHRDQKELYLRTQIHHHITVAQQIQAKNPQMMEESLKQAHDQAFMDMLTKK
jgi:hypothetical protein